MFGFIVDELVFAATEQIREEARLARPHVARGPVRPVLLHNPLARVDSDLGSDTDATELRNRERRRCR
jgi:hypothetical protein